MNRCASIFLLLALLGCSVPIVSRTKTAATGGTICIGEDGSADPATAKGDPACSMHANALVTVGVTPVLFVLWNLPTLAIASGISSLFFAIAGFIFVIRPYRKWRKTAH